MPDMPAIRMLYAVRFFTYGEIDPKRLGTQERQIGTVKVWATDADHAQEEAKRVVGAMGHEWLKTLEVVVPYNDLFVEQIMNDPLNPNAKLPGAEPEKKESNVVTLV